MVAVAIDAHSINPRLHRALTEHLPNTERLINESAFNQDLWTIPCVPERGTGHRLGHRCVHPRDVEVSRTAVLHKQDNLPVDRFETLIDEATASIVRCLQRSASRH
jgi:hypothetical protein